MKAILSINTWLHDPEKMFHCVFYKSSTEHVRGAQTFVINIYATMYIHWEVKGHAAHDLLHCPFIGLYITFASPI